MTSTKTTTIGDTAASPRATRSDEATDAPTAAEFDRYADDYEAGMENPIKRMVGRRADDFIEPKARWLLKQLHAGNWSATTARPPRILDYGCGTGLLLKHVRRLGFRGTLRGCDASAAMLDHAARMWREGPAPAWDVVPQDALPYEDGEFDVVVLSAVLHHVTPAERGRVVVEAARVLSPGGRLCIFEHNPFHPVTTYVVRHTAVDKKAQLLSPRQVREQMRKAGLQVAVTHYLLFLPPRWKWARVLETHLRRLPLGGQFVVCGRKMPFDPSTHPKAATNMRARRAGVTSLTRNRLLFRANCKRGSCSFNR